MKTQMLKANVMVGRNEAGLEASRRILLLCGILSSLLYVVGTCLAALRWEGYNPAAQAISELIGIDAPSAPFLVPIMIIYAILVYLFGLGIWLSAGGKRALRIAAILIIAKEILGILATLFAPIHMRGVSATMTDTWHLIFTAAGVMVCMLPAMGFSAAVLGKRFRLYTILTMLLFFLCAVLSGVDATRLAGNLSTPLLGVWERINVYSYMLWVIVLAVILFRDPLNSLTKKDHQ